MITNRLLCLLTAPILLTAIALSALAESKGPEGDSCVLAKSAFEDAQRIRGLKKKREVPCFRQTKDQVRNYLLTAIREKLPAQKLALEGLLFRGIGLLPDTFDYEQGLIDLYLSQLGGYYEPKTKHFVMAAWMPDSLQHHVAVHELTHALQDQHYNLEKFIDDSQATTDEALARSALVEGDATAVMMDFLREMTHQPSIAQEANIDSLLFQNVLGMTFMGSSEVPTSLKMLLLFPYTSGLRFAHAELRKGGYREIDKVFKNPPLSTEEILHPESYGSGQLGSAPVKVEEVLPVAEFDPKKYELLHSDVMGEFVTSLILGEGVTDKLKVAEAAAGWGGDRAALFADHSGTGDGRGVLLGWRTRWDTVADAAEFGALFRQALRSRHPNFNPDSNALQRVDANKKIQFTNIEKEALFIVALGKGYKGVETLLTK